jgi:Flp pilus assembly protein TadD
MTGVSRTMHQQVVNAVEAGTGDPVVARLRNRLAVNPDDLRSRVELAALYRQSGFPDLALEHYRMAATRSPDSADVAILIARTLDEQHLTGEARRHLEVFTAAHPDSSAEAWSWLGILEDAQGDYAAGEKSHRAALRLRDRSDALHNNLGYNLLLQKKSGEAVAEFRRALEIAPGSAFARNNLGVALAGQPDQAVQEWQDVSDKASAHNNLAAILMENGDFAEARRQLELALAFNREHPAALRNLQLLADVEGGSIAFPAGLPESSWRRFVRSLGHVILGPDTLTAKPAATAQAPGSGAGAQ